VIVTYTAFGLTLRSDLSIPGLPIVSVSSLPDIDIHLGAKPPGVEVPPPDPEPLWFASRFLDETGTPTLRIWEAAKGALLHLVYSDGTEFWLDRRGAEIWSTWPAPLTVADVATYLLGPILGLMLRIRGITCLHASAVAVGNRAVAFVGPAGAGKSTTAAALVRLGWAVLADDIVAVQEQNENFLALPSFPHLSLLPESVGMLYGATDVLPHFTPHWEKRRLGLEGLHFQNQALPLQVIYLLGEREGTLGLRIENTTAQTALLSLVANTYANTLLDAPMRATEFTLLGRVVSRVPVRTLHAHLDPSHLSELGDLISENCRLSQPENLETPLF